MVVYTLYISKKTSGFLTQPIQHVSFGMHHNYLILCKHGVQIKHFEIKCDIFVTCLMTLSHGLCQQGGHFPSVKL